MRNVSALARFPSALSPLFGCLLVGVTGCSGTTATPAAPVEAKLATTCGLAPGAVALEPVGDYAVGGTVALARHGARTLAIVADEDAKALITVDIDAGKELAQTPLSGTPSQVMVTGDGRLLVALRDRGQLAVLSAGADASEPLSAGCAVPTPSDPVGLAATPDGADILVTSGWGHALTVLSAVDLRQKASLDVPREPRAVVVSDDGTRAFVSHSVGSWITVVNLSDEHRSNAISLVVDPFASSRDRRPGLVESIASALTGGRDDERTPGRMGRRAGCQGYALAKSVEPSGRILAPQVLVDPGDPEGAAGGYGDPNTPTEAVNVAVLDEKLGDILPASVSTSDFGLRGSMRDPRDPAPQECLLPRAAAVDPATHSLLVTCYGIGAVVAYDSSAATPAMIEKRRWKVGAGPSGVRIDPDHRRAVVWAQFDRSVQILELDAAHLVDDGNLGEPPQARIDLAPSPNGPDFQVRLGRELFHSVGDPRVSQDGRACASCHPDGRDDALTWATPDGPRRTKMLAGRITDTAPYAWDGNADDVETHLTHTFQRLNGQGLRGMELDALLAYLHSIAPPRPEVDPNHPLVREGRRIFESEQAACATCHDVDAAYTDRRVHDVGSKAVADTTKTFDTPDLRFLSGRAPYFHDGRYESLSEMLRDIDGRMGHTAHLSPKDLEALEAYLLSL